jgi:hypothetical protein
VDWILGFIKVNVKIEAGMLFGRREGVTSFGSRLRFVFFNWAQILRLNSFERVPTPSVNWYFPSLVQMSVEDKVYYTNDHENRI